MTAVYRFLDKLTPHGGRRLALAFAVVSDAAVVWLVHWLLS